MAAPTKCRVGHHKCRRLFVIQHRTATSAVSFLQSNPAEWQRFQNSLCTFVHLWCTLGLASNRIHMGNKDEITPVNRMERT